MYSDVTSGKTIGEIQFKNVARVLEDKDVLDVQFKEKDEHVYLKPKDISRWQRIIIEWSSFQQVQPVGSFLSTNSGQALRKSDKGASNKKLTTSASSTTTTSSSLQQSATLFESAGFKMDSQQQWMGVVYRLKEDLMLHCCPAEGEKDPIGFVDVRSIVNVRILGMNPSGVVAMELMMESGKRLMGMESKRLAEDWKSWLHPSGSYRKRIITTSSSVSSVSVSPRMKVDTSVSTAPTPLHAMPVLEEDGVSYISGERVEVESLDSYESTTMEVPEMGDFEISMETESEIVQQPKTVTVALHKMLGNFDGDCVRSEVASDEVSVITDGLEELLQACENAPKDAKSGRSLLDGSSSDMIVIRKRFDTVKADQETIQAAISKVVLQRVPMDSSKDEISLASERAKVAIRLKEGMDHVVSAPQESSSRRTPLLSNQRRAVSPRRQAVTTKEPAADDLSELAPAETAPRPDESLRKSRGAAASPTPSRTRPDLFARASFTDPPPAATERKSPTMRRDAPSSGSASPMSASPVAIKREPRSRGAAQDPSMRRSDDSHLESMERTLAPPLVRNSSAAVLERTPPINAERRSGRTETAASPPSKRIPPPPFFAPSPPPGGSSPPPQFPPKRNIY